MTKRWRVGDAINGPEDMHSLPYPADLELMNKYGRVVRITVAPGCILDATWCSARVVSLPSDYEAETARLEAEAAQKYREPFVDAASVHNITSPARDADPMREEREEFIDAQTRIGANRWHTFVGNRICDAIRYDKPLGSLAVEWDRMHGGAK